MIMMSSTGDNQVGGGGGGGTVDGGLSTTQWPGRSMYIEQLVNCGRMSRKSCWRTESCLQVYSDLG